MTNPTRSFFVLLALITLTGCATNFEPPALSANHPASAQAPEAPRVGMQRLAVHDDLTQKTNAQLARKDAPNPDFQSGGMSHDMSSMGGMEHSKMPGMTMPEPTTTASPSSKEAAEMEMKKTSNEMKKLSDEMQPKSDAQKSTTKPSPNSTQPPQTTAAYWTCVMHPEIHADKPGKCPKCGMTLVKKEGGAK
ncbi:MAG: heavy metal-binding domain-containing protein [Verrucomicrobiota bacterium]